jgi:phosphoglycolate phosphatase-like HAD superfamily hydrolase
MRTRFFAGRKPRRIRELTKRVIEKSKQYDNASRFVSFPIYEELRKTGKQKVNAEKIREVFGKESPFEHYDRKLNVVDTTRLALHDLVQLNIPTAVATTNLEGIAQTLVEQTEYEFLAEQEFNKYYGSKNVVLGTRLKQKGKLLGPEIDGLPLAGNAKAQAVLRFASKMNREPKVFLGDSPSGDLETVIATLQREGSVYLVGSDADDVARKFRKKLLDVFGAHGGEMDNVFCIESGQEGFAH